MKFLTPPKEVKPYNFFVLQGARENNTYYPQVVNLEVVLTISREDRTGDNYQKDNYILIFSASIDEASVYWYFETKKDRDNYYNKLMRAVNAKDIADI